MHSSAGRAREDSPNAQAALEEMHRLRVFAELVRDFGEIRERFGIIGVQHTASLHRAFLGLAKVFERVGQRIGAEEHLAVVKQHANVLRMQGRWLAHWHTVCYVGWSEGCRARAA